MMKITIQEKEVGLLFDYPCFKDFMTGLYQFPDKYQDGDASFTSLGLAKLVLSAHENFSMIEKKAYVVSYGDIAEWVDQSFTTEQGKAVIAEILNEWAKSTHVQKMITEHQKKSQETESLSLSTSTQSNPSVMEG